MLQSQVYLVTNFSSYSSVTPSVSITKVASIPRSNYLSKLSSTLFLDTIHLFVPFSSLIYPKQKSETILINLVQNFENKKFSLSRLNFDLFCVKLPQIKVIKAEVEVETVTYGLRYIMRNWFWTTAIIAVFFMANGISAVVIVLLFILKLIFRIKLSKWMCIQFYYEKDQRALFSVTSTVQRKNFENSILFINHKGIWKKVIVASWQKILIF